MGKHFYTIDPDEVTRAIVHDGRILEGVVCYVLPPTANPQPPIIPLYRLYNPGSDDHLYTIHQRERDERLSEGYINDGVPIACNVFDPNQAPAEARPLYRAVNFQRGENFYTANFQEFSNLTTPPPLGVGDFLADDPAGYIYDLNQTAVPQGALPFYRLFTP